MDSNDVCRLCLTTDDLVWVFDKRFESQDSMKDVIHVTTGVEITTKDIVSQKICKKCCQVTIKMFEFRKTSLNNDKLLKDRCRDLLKDKVMKIPNTQIIIRTEPRKIVTPIRENKTDARYSEGEAKERQRKSKELTQQEPKKYDDRLKAEAKPVYKIHPTVRELFKVYPQIKLPTVCLKYNIAPCVAMKMDHVEQYFRSRNLDFRTHTKLALNAGKVATKRTSSKQNGLSPKSVISKMLKDERAKIKLSPSSSKVNDNRVQEDKQDEFRLFSPKTTVINHSPSNKRKLSDLETADAGEFKKVNFAEFLGLAPKTSESQGRYVANKTLQVHICEICNSVQYSSKDLRKHQNKHLRCQFCKLNFRSLESKQEHLDSKCIIKNTMNNLPDVVLSRIESNEWARKAYPTAFEGLVKREAVIKESSLDTKDDGSSDSEQAASKDSGNDGGVKESRIPPLDSCEIIEILSDDEDLSTSFGVSAAPVTAPHNTSLPSTPQVNDSIIQPAPENIVYNTVSIVRPDIKIKGSCALDVIDARLTDVRVLKELLIHYRPVRLEADKNVQTELPSHDSITVNFLERSAELTSLKQQLHVYKIPVVMRNGVFNVCFNFKPEVKQLKKLCLWNDLTPIDIKPTSGRVAPKVAQSDSVTSPQNRGLLSTTSKFIRVSTSALSPIITSPFTAPTASVVNVNSTPNEYPNEETSVQASGDSAASTVDAEETTGGPQLGLIRVKNVWELT